MKFRGARLLAPGFLCALGLLGSAQAADGREAARWRQHAHDTTLIRDNWGIAHVYGKSDADAVFGMIYAQAEDDFGRMSGGESGDPASLHFTDQALMFTQGQFRDVLFTRADVAAHAERTYHP